MYDDQPPFGADERCRAAFFGDHPLARSVLGTVASIEALPVAAMRDYLGRRYAPEGMVLAATGAVDFSGLVASARSLCGGWEPRGATRRLAPAAAWIEAAGGGRGTPSRETIMRPAATLAYGIHATAGPDERDDDRYAAKLLATVLGDGSGSRLYWSLVDSGEAEQATCQHLDFLDAGLFVTQLACDADDAAPLLERALGIYADARASGIPAAEFEQARNKLAGRVVLAGEKPRRRLFDVGLEWSRSGRYRTVAETLGIVESLTPDDVERVQTAWPLSGPGATVLAGPFPAA